MGVRRGAVAAQHVTLLAVVALLLAAVPVACAGEAVAHTDAALLDEGAQHVWEVRPPAGHTLLAHFLLSATPIEGCGNGTHLTVDVTSDGVAVATSPATLRAERPEVMLISVGTNVSDLVLINATAMECTAAVSLTLSWWRVDAEQPPAIISSNPFPAPALQALALPAGAAYMQSVTLTLLSPCQGTDVTRAVSGSVFISTSGQALHQRFALKGPGDSHTFTVGRAVPRQVEVRVGIDAPGCGGAAQFRLSAMARYVPGLAESAPSVTSRPHSHHLEAAGLIAAGAVMLCVLCTQLLLYACRSQNSVSSSSERQGFYRRAPKSLKAYRALDVYA